MSERSKKHQWPTRPGGSLATFLFLLRCGVICASITEQTTEKWNLFVKYSIVILGRSCCKYRVINVRIHDFKQIYKRISSKIKVKEYSEKSINWNCSFMVNLKYFKLVECLNSIRWHATSSNLKLPDKVLVVSTC